MVRIFRGGVLDERFEGSVVVIGPRPTTMTGLVRGDLFVRDSSVCDVTGMVSGNLLAERTGKAVLHGLVTKAAKAAGGDLEVYGMVQGDVVNEGGRLYVDKGAVVRGKVIGQTHSGPLPPPEKPVTAPTAATSPTTTPAPAVSPPKPPAAPGP
jgi:autotransporter passenger strand-loop-strand repeat protein